MQKPVWKAMWNSTTPVTVSSRPRSSVSERTGIIRIWNGMKLPAMNSANSSVFPLKS